MLRFLLNHKSFKNDLIYESYCIFKFLENNKKIKVYSTMHTVD